MQIAVLPTQTLKAFRLPQWSNIHNTFHFNAELGFGEQLYTLHLFILSKLKPVSSDTGFVFVFSAVDVIYVRK